MGLEWNAMVVLSQHPGSSQEEHGSPPHDAYEDVLRE